MCSGRLMLSARLTSGSHPLTPTLLHRMAQQSVSLTLDPRLSVYVRDGSTNTAVEGASVGGVQTNAQGIPILNRAAGEYILKATRQDSLRSNAITLFVG